MITEIAKMIDHSLLHPAMNDKDLREGCLLARKYNVASVCIKPYAVKMAVEILKGSEVKVGTVVGFPHGNSLIEVKVIETEKAISDGAEEIDLARAEEAMRRAQQRIKEHPLEVDTARAEAALRRSLIRLKVGERRRRRSQERKTV